MIPWDIAQHFFGVKSTFTGSRSTILSILAWMAAILLSGLVSLVHFNGAPLLVIMVAVMLAADFVVFLGMFIYFALTDPDKLRSEHFSIQKLAIEQHLLGDSSSGTFIREEASREESTQVAPKSGQDSSDV